MEIVPAFLVESQQEFETKLKLVEPHAKLIQVDVLDGSLFGNTNWYDAQQIGVIAKQIEIELHLMVEKDVAVEDQVKRVLESHEIPLKGIFKTTPSLEDVFVAEDHRGRGIGTMLVKAIVQEAEQHCYKLIATSRHARPKVHDMYKKLGFVDHGTEFRVDF